MRNKTSGEASKGELTVWERYKRTKKSKKVKKLFAESEYFEIDEEGSLVPTRELLSRMPYSIGLPPEDVEEITKVVGIPPSSLYLHKL